MHKVRMIMRGASELWKALPASSMLLCRRQSGEAQGCIVLPCHNALSAVPGRNLLRKQCSNQTVTINRAPCRRLTLLQHICTLLGPSRSQLSGRQLMLPLEALAEKTSCQPQPLLKWNRMVLGQKMQCSLQMMALRWVRV